MAFVEAVTEAVRGRNPRWLRLLCIRLAEEFDASPDERLAGRLILAMRAIGAAEPSGSGHDEVAAWRAARQARQARRP